MTRTRANLLLLFTSILWGSGFVVLKFAIDAQATPGFINFFRGTLFTMLAFAFFSKNILRMSLKEFKIGLFAGLLNSAGFITQTIGVAYTTPSKNAFISSAYVVIIPFIAWIIYRQRVQFKSFVAIALCTVGMAVLTGISAQFSMNRGDFFSLICAFFYAGSIVILSNGAKHANAQSITFMLAIVQAAGGLIYFLFEGPSQLLSIDWSGAIIPLLYVSIFCSFIGQAIQVSAQKFTSAASAGLIMMLEGVFGSLFSIFFGFDHWSLHLIAGGLLITISLLLMEIDVAPVLQRFRFNHQSVHLPLHEKSSK